MCNFLLAFLMALSFFLAPVSTFAAAADLSPAVSGLSKEFSKKFCTSIGKGMAPQKAGESAAAQLSKGLLFSPIINEIMSAPKEDLTASLSNNIFNECGKDLGGTKEELYNYLAELANKIPNKSTKTFQLAPIRQKRST